MRRPRDNPKPRLLNELHLTVASVALRRLASCTAKNRFYRANRDLGRVFKTKFLLGYLSELGW